MNRKRRVTKRTPTEHTTKWERLDEYKIGPRRTLRAGQIVKVHNEYAAEFEFLYAERHVETGAVSLTFLGGRRGHRLVRSFTPDKVGRFIRKART